MKKPMLVAFSILLMLFAFVACQGNPTEIPEEQIEAENLAEDYLSSIRYADVLYKVFEGETGIELKASTANSITVSFKDYTGEAVKKTGDIEGIKSGVLEYTFNEPSEKTLSDKSYTIKTIEPLVFMLKEGATAETTISFTISGSCKIDLQITSDEITGIGAGAFFGKIESGTITVGEGEDAIEVDPDNVNITIDNESDSSGETEAKILILEANTDYSTIKGSLNEYDGIKGTAKSIILNVDETIVLNRSFSFESITLDGGQTEQESKETPIGINLSSSRDDITITIKDSVIKNFGYAITSNKANGSGETGTVDSGSLTLNIENTDFSNCYKGLYATDIKNLTVKGGSYTDMGAASTVDGNDVVKRSGAAFDINQMSEGEAITFTNVIFTRCGGTGEADELTSGAIKVKVRGGEGDDKPDIPYSAANGKLDSLTIEGCTFTDNRMDVVLGTSNIASTDDITTITIQETGCDVENNAEPENT